MSTLAITAVTFVIALFVIFGIVIINHVSALVKNAYQIKVEIRSEMEDGLAAIEHEMELRSRATRQDLLGEASKIKTTFEIEIQRRFTEMETSLKAKLTTSEEAVRLDRGKLVKAIENVREQLHDHDQTLQAWRRQVRAKNLEEVVETPEPQVELP